MAVEELVIEAIKIFATLLGAIVFAWYWNWRNHKLARYRYLDEAYSKLLEAYLAYPQFSDPKRTQDYKQSFGEDAQRYHCFAMAAHSVMETIWELSGGRIENEKEWIRIFEHHAQLHREWLRDNQGANRDDYVNRVLNDGRVTCPR